MAKLCVFAGTTEGRQLVELLAAQSVDVTACVATEYGEALLPQASGVTVSAARLTREEMQELFRREGFDLVVDATHPYASAVTENIVWACEKEKTDYLRILRSEEQVTEDCIFVENMQAAAQFLEETQGNILLTTGSKELSALAGMRNFSERCYARVLPMQQSLSLCAEAGLQPSHIIAMQGPFSQELNIAMLRSVSAAWMLTKQSGAAGGFDEKIAAARMAGAKAVVIGRPPQMDGLPYGEAVKELCTRFSLHPVPQVTVAGIGPGSLEGMTGEVLEAMRQADCLIGASRMLEAAASFKKPGFSATKPEKIAEFILNHPQYQRFTVLMSGDSGFYSGTKNLLPLLERCTLRVLPGISSLSCLCARVGLFYEDIVPVSLHGREGDVAAQLRRHGKLFVLVGGENGAGALFRRLTEANLGAARAFVGERLGYEDEQVTSGTVETLADRHFQSLSAVILLWDGPWSCVTGGLPDECFLRAEEVPMTKSEVRAVCLSKLRLEENSICWDVGAGTGSVALEMGRLAEKGHVYAVEKKENALALLEENRKKLGLSNVSVISGTAPAALEDLPAPSHVFIGGSSGSIQTILDVILRKNPHARIVATAIALETAAQLTVCMKEFDRAEVVSLSVARGRSVGAYHLMTGQNPIYVFTLQRGGEQA